MSPKESNREDTIKPKPVIFKLKTIYFVSIVPDDLTLPEYFTVSTPHPHGTNGS